MTTGRINQVSREKNRGWFGRALEADPSTARSSSPTEAGGHGPRVSRLKEPLPSWEGVTGTAAAARSDQQRASRGAWARDGTARGEIHLACGGWSRRTGVSRTRCNFHLVDASPRTSVGNLGSRCRMCRWPSTGHRAPRSGPRGLNRGPSRGPGPQDA